MNTHIKSVAEQRAHINVHGDLASRALQPMSAGPTNEHRLDPLVEARLTEVVQRLRASWLAGPALLWGDVHTIRELTVPDIDKRVASTLARGFFQFSQFLAGYEVLTLELKESGVVSEKTLLGLEQLLHDGGCLFADESPISGG